MDTAGSTAGERPSVTLDFADAWRGGSSLLVAGALTGPATIGLHATRLPLTRTAVAELVHSGGVSVEFGVATREAAAPGEPVPYTWLAAPAAAGAAPGWRTSRVPLATLAGKTAYALAVRITRRGTSAVSWRLGALTVRDTAAGRPPAPPAHLRVAASARRGPEAELRLRWDRAAGPVRHYELHRLLPDGTRRFLAGTCGTALHLPSVTRAGREREAAFELRTVDEAYAVSAPARTALRW